MTIATLTHCGTWLPAGLALPPGFAAVLFWPGNQTGAQLGSPTLISPAVTPANQSCGWDESRPLVFSCPPYGRREEKAIQ